MIKSDKNKSENYVKLKPTIFPLGFGVSKVGKSFLMINFIDELNNKKTILESVALSIDKAKQLSEALRDAIEHSIDE